MPRKNTVGEKESLGALILSVFALFFPLVAPLPMILTSRLRKEAKEEGAELDKGVGVAYFISIIAMALLVIGVISFFAFLILGNSITDKATPV